MFCFGKDCKTRKVGSAASAGTSAVESSVVDMAGFKEVTFFASIAVANAGNHIKIQQNEASSTSSMADLTGTKVICANNGEVVMCTVVKPLKRYVRAVITRTASSASGEIYCVQSNPLAAPVDNNVSSAIVSEVHASPAEGTA